MSIGDMNAGGDEAPICIMDGCLRPVKIKRDQLCSRHYMRKLQGRPMDTPEGERAMPKCCIEGCDRNVRRAGSMCSLHRRRVERNGDPLLLKYRSSDGVREEDPSTWHAHTTKGGYVMLQSNFDGVRLNKLQHRHVMELQLGRGLLPEETVHHVNGDRADNRPENLELWSSRHPKGQRVEDKIQWAIELLMLYRPSALDLRHERGEAA